MNKIRRKDYTLYLRLNGKEIELLKDTLEEIDDFTTCFVDASSMYKKFIDCNTENIRYEFFIKSSRNNRYSVLYYKYRNLLHPSNLNKIAAYLNQLSREELISFLDNFTKIIYYIEDGVNDNKIPICELYSNLTNGLSYSYSLRKYIESDYKNYRLAAMYIIDRYDLDLSSFPFGDINHVKKIISDIQNNLINLLPEVNKKTKSASSIDDDYSLCQPKETLDERIYAIINNDNLDTNEKEQELELLIDDLDRLRDTKDMLYKKKM